jgi:hypothetical protein
MGRFGKEPRRFRHEKCGTDQFDRQKIFHAGSMLPGFYFNMKEIILTVVA